MVDLGPKKIEVADQVPYWEPKWRKDAPNDLMMVASNGNRHIVLSFIGSAVEYWRENITTLEDWFDGGQSLDPGIWMVEVRGDASYDSYTGEHDFDLVFISDRMATTEEVELQASGDYPWDPVLWMENWEAVREGEPVDKVPTIECAACRSLLEKETGSIMDPVAGFCAQCGTVSIFECCDACDPAGRKFATPRTLETER